MKKIILILIIVTGLVSCQSKIYLEDGIIKCIEDVKVGSVIELDGESYKVVDEMMFIEMMVNGDDITYICTSKITNMEYMFAKFPYFNGDISKWDVSNVKTMSNMFRNSEFNGDRSKWDVSNVQYY